MAADASDGGLSYRLFDLHQVSVGDVGGDDFNTLVLGGVEVVLPVEMDVDGDPLQDDVVSLRGVHGHYEQTLTSSHPDVVADEDARLLYYRFRHVPAGLYRLAVRVGDAWTPLGREVLVCRDGVFVGDRKLLAEPTVFRAAPFEQADDDDTVEREPCVR